MSNHVLCHRKKGSRRSLRDMGLQAVVNVFFILFCFLCIYPFYYVVIYSLSDGERALMEGISFFPSL